MGTSFPSFSVSFTLFPNCGLPFVVSAAWASPGMWGGACIWSSSLQVLGIRNSWVKSKDQCFNLPPGDFDAAQVWNTVLRIRNMQTMSHGPSPPCCLVLHSCGANNDLYTFQWLKGEYYFVTCKNGLTFKFQCLHKCSFILTWSHPFTHASPVAAFALQRQRWVVAAETKWPIEPKTVLSDPFQQEFACSCSKPFVSFSSFFKKRI